MRYLSVCSGIEAATVAWHPLGWMPAAFSEIEPFPRAVLAHHYPDVPLHGDFTTIRGDEYGAVDLLVGGTPCQDFSVAGLRAGMDGARGALTLEFLRLLDRVRPRWMVWENVPGVLSANGGRAFGAFLGGLEKLGYGWAYRVLDAQYFDVPQRRRRVFVVGYFGDARRAAAVLFERHSLSGHPAPRREARPGAADIVARSVALRGREGGGLAELGDDQAHALRASSGGGDKPYAIIASALTANMVGGGGGADDNAAQANHLVSADVAPTLSSSGAGTERTGNERTEADFLVAYQCHGNNIGVAGTLRAGNGGLTGGVPFITFDTTQVTSAANRSNPKPGDPCHPLAAGAHAPAIAFAWQAGGTQTTLGYDPSSSSAPTLSANQTPAIAFSCKDHGADAGEMATTLRAMEHNTSHANAGGQIAIAGASAVRRLTPRECERLQGFPDDYTAVPYRGKPAADGPRYRALGNSMAVPCMAWLGQRIAAVDALANDEQEAAS